jgi:nitrogen fixation NifU-like protein
VVQKEVKGEKRAEAVASGRDEAAAAREVRGRGPKANASAPSAVRKHLMSEARLAGCCTVSSVDLSWSAPSNGLHVEPMVMGGVELVSREERGAPPKPEHSIPLDIRPVVAKESPLCWRRHRSMGRLPEASAMAKICGRCGDTMEMYLRIEDERIVEARFFTDGCGSSVACGLTAAKLATGKEIDEAALIGGDTILDVLDGLAEKERHCAYLAAETLQAAIHDWMVREWVGRRKP